MLLKLILTCAEPECLIFLRMAILLLTNSLSRFRYPGNESGQNRDAYDQGVATLSPAVDDEYSKIWLLQ